MIHYRDTSALAKRYVQEADPTAVRSLFWAADASLVESARAEGLRTTLVR